ncbi:hypothetical protein VKT23_015716 [Stygiomarasmius scandens]|uniref:Heterokaryon incompatibility domain-containing protein n=1 Tax=Marasmiellus scandens TaxID=2682957 RepID=A0ABR1IX90_9AGAR
MLRPKSNNSSISVVSHNFPSDTLKRLRSHFSRSTHADTIFPFSALSDKEWNLFLNSNAVPLYPSHRLVREKKGIITARKNPTSPGMMAAMDICPRRLIDTYSLKLVEFGNAEIIPSYAILSHRWVQGEEVLYAEFLQSQDGGGKFSKPKEGYRKIEAACRQAREDGIRFIWIDTCCVEQGNHVDVAANITSMYGYYQNAKVCYVYLADIEKHDMFNKEDRLGIHQRSEWLYRGWTLQELIAPRTVVFFNKHWERIGDKYKLREKLYEVTAVPSLVLSGKQPVQNVDVLTRMSWSFSRRTTKIQDGAYCLQGLLGVSIEPNYDESSLASFNRLGKALFDAHPELKDRLGINKDLFRDPNSDSFLHLLLNRFYNARDTINNSR